MSNKKKRKNSNYKNHGKETVVKKSKLNTSTIVLIIVAAIALLSVILCLAFCERTDYDNACEYFETRSTEGRDIKYAKISVKDHGNIIILLDASTAPVSVENFLKLANSGFYDGLTFHRIMEDFMIQGGDPKGTGGGGSDETIKGEFAANGVENDISHKRGVISMARSDPYDSASSQFFICNTDYPYLDGNYAAFGYVISGLDVVDSITEYGIQYTYNGVIYDKTKQPVITEIVEISEEEALKYTK